MPEEIQTEDPKPAVPTAVTFSGASVEDVIAQLRTAGHLPEVAQAPPPEVRIGYDWPMTDDEDGPDMDEFFAAFGLMESCAEFCEAMSNVAAEAAADACMDTAMTTEQKVAACGDAYRAQIDNMAAAWGTCVASMPMSMHAQATRSGKAAAGTEFRTFTRAASVDGRKVSGYPLIFNELSQDLGGFRERILPTAVTFADDVRADFNHSPDFILGRRNAGTLDLSVDSTGVKMIADAPDTTWANDLITSIKRGDIDQGSFAFRVLPNGQTWEKINGENIRTLTSILVSRVSVVSDPAYTQTSIQVRNLLKRDRKAPVESRAKTDPAPAPVVEVVPEPQQDSDAAGLAAPPAFDLMLRDLELSLAGV